jgi:ABC-type Fe3+-hydroxamate transport system substrate-binding protein
MLHVRQKREVIMKISRKIISAVLAASMLAGSAAFLTSCGEPSDYPVKIGSKEIKTEPEKIVILDKNLTDIVSAIGYDGKLTGRSDEVNQKGVEVVPSVGTELDPSCDKIIKAGAEVVLSDGSIDDAAIKQLEKSGTKVFSFETANTPKQLSALYKKLGTILGGNVKGAEKAQKAYKELSDTMNDVKDALMGYSVVKTACYLYIDNGVLKTAGPGTWASTMLGYTGAVNVFTNSKSDVVDISELRLSNPDYIFIDNENVADYLNSSEMLAKLKALDGNIFTIPRDEITMQGFTALDVLEKMVKEMYPEEN